MSSGTAIQCCICNDEITPGEKFKTRDTDGATVHTSCLNSQPHGASVSSTADSNQNAEHKSSPEADPHRDALKRVVIEVLSECFANVDFSFLDQMIDEKIEAKLSK